MDILNSYSQQNFLRVTSRQPCPICGKPDWCLRSPDGGAAICARIKSGKPVGKQEHAGWLHVLRSGRSVGMSANSRKVQTCRLNCNASKDLAPVGMPAETFESLSLMYVAALAPERLGQIAKSLGLTPEALQQIELGWSVAHAAYSFPMRDASGTVIGIRLRSAATGKKFAVRGSRQGLFLPRTIGNEQWVITEGPTDCAAMLGLEFDAVGRPSCSGGVRLLTEMVKVRRPSQVVIVADADEPGQVGAARLADALTTYGTVRMITPPAKDAREWQARGATRDDILKAIAATPPRKLNVTTRLLGGRS